MSDPSLFGPASPPPPAQWQSPTSLAAAEAAKSFAPGYRKQVLMFLYEEGAKTDEQIADALHMNPSTARPRRVELLRQDLIYRMGERKTKSGRAAGCYSLTVKGEHVAYLLSQI